MLGAFQNVADTLMALEQDAEGLKAAAASDDAAKTTLDLTQRQLQDGYTNTLGLLSAEQAYQQAEIALVQAAGQPLRRHRRTVPGAGRRLVASQRSERGPKMVELNKIAALRRAASDRGLRPEIQSQSAAGRPMSH